MVEFKALKLADVEEMVDGFVTIRLKDGFDWFFSQEFKELKSGFMTGDDLLELLIHTEQKLRKKRKSGPGKI